MQRICKDQYIPFFISLGQVKPSGKLILAKIFFQIVYVILEKAKFWKWGKQLFLDMLSSAV